MQTSRDKKRNKKSAVKGRCVIGSLTRVMRVRNVSIEVERSLRNSIILPILD